jgi:molybdopterin molybdotransferase
VLKELHRYNNLNIKEKDMSEKKMIPLEEALEIAGGYRVQSQREKISFTDSPGRVLAEDIFSDMDMPPFNRSAVDGFACRRDDLPGPLRVIETIPAGTYPLKQILKGECSRIMTGAAVPEGADTVFMVEDSCEEEPGVTFTGKQTKDNISFKGEDIGRGDRVLTRGRVIRPQDIAVMATVGATEVEVVKKLNIAVISTGDELVEPHTKPARGEIRNSNAYQLIAQVIRAGANAVYYGIAGDSEEHTAEIVNRAIAECDIVLLTGGVSMGDYDFVPVVLEKAGVEILFDKVAVQPGKPTTLGIHKDAVVFGLPGNPVSAFIQFEVFVRPMIHRSMDSDWQPEVVRMVLSEGYSRKRAGRFAWVPVVRDGNGGIIAAEYHGSAHINALPGAYGIIGIPVGVNEIKGGEEVDVRFI